MSINAGDILTYNGSVWVNQPWVQGPFAVGAAASSSQQMLVQSSSTSLLPLVVQAAVAAPSVDLAQFQDGSGNALMTVLRPVANTRSAGLSFRFGTQIYEQDTDNGFGSAKRMIFQPHGSNYDVLTEDGSNYILRASATGNSFYSGTGSNKFYQSSSAIGNIFQFVSSPSQSVIEVQDSSGRALFDFDVNCDQLFSRVDSTSVSVPVGKISATFNSNVHATYTGRLLFSAEDYGGLREGIRLEGTGSAAALGFFGAAAVVQQANASQATVNSVTDANAKAALQSLYNALKNLGLCAATA